MKSMQLWILTALWLGAGGGNVPGAAQAKIRILTSFPPVYCFTANVAGDLAVVENLLPPGADPHDYSLSPQAARRLAAADLLIVNGLGLESWLQRAFQNVARPQTLVVISAGLENDLIYEVPSFSAETSSGLQAARGRPGSRSLAAPNPHIWLDPVLAGRAVSNILLALQKADPANAAGYATNAARYEARLAALDAEIRAALAPAKGSWLVTFHDSFAYFARRYDLRVAGVIEKTPTIAPTPKELTALRQIVQGCRVKAIFSDPDSPRKLAGQIGRDLKLPVAQLDPLESGPLRPEAYEDGMRSNLRVFAQYLK